MSQLALSIEAEVSSKHLSFLENGRTHPSREMVLVLASALELPLQERNDLLLAAGYAPVYQAPDLDDPSMAAVRRTLSFLLERHEPYGAVVLDRRWNIRVANAGYARMLGWLSGQPIPPPGPQGQWDSPPVAGGNLLEGVFDPAHLRPLVANFDEVACSMLAWVQREATGDSEAQQLLETLLAKPGIPQDWRRTTARSPALMVPLVLAKDGHRLTFVTTLTTLGTPRDLLAQEFRLETFFPADDATDRAVRAIFAGEALPPR